MNFVDHLTRNQSSAVGNGHLKSCGGCKRNTPRNERSTRWLVLELRVQSTVAVSMVAVILRWLASNVTVQHWNKRGDILIDTREEYPRQKGGGAGRRGGGVRGGREKKQFCMFRRLLWGQWCKKSFYIDRCVSTIYLFNIFLVISFSLSACWTFSVIRFQYWHPSMVAQVKHDVSSGPVFNCTDAIA